MPGTVALAFDAMLIEDMKIPEAGEKTQHIPVPFGRTTGMIEHLVWQTAAFQAELCLLLPLKQPIISN